MEEYVLQMEKVTKETREGRLLDEVTLEIGRGRIYGLIGESGAGKTLLMRVAAGLTSITSGTFRLFGAEGGKELLAARKRTGFAFEEPFCVGFLSAEQNMQAAMRLRGISRGGVFSGRADRERVSEVMSRAGLSEQAERRRSLGNYAPGPRKQFALAEAFLGEPEFLMADEIVRGANLEGSRIMTRLLREEQKKRGMTILVTNPGIRELYDMADEYILMSRGRVARRFPKKLLEETCDQVITVTCDNPDYAAKLLSELSPGETEREGDVIRVFGKTVSAEDVKEKLTACGIRGVRAEKAGCGLEDYYRKLVEEN